MKFILHENQLKWCTTDSDKKYNHNKQLYEVEYVISKNCKPTRTDNDFPGQYMSQAKHNDDQTEVRIYHNHGNASSLEATDVQGKKGGLMKEKLKIKTS